MNGQVWYTADLHFGHEMVALKRGFDSAAEHNRELIRRWNEKVAPGDVVWILGDVCLNPRNLETTRLLHGTKHLITGNHDKVFPGHSDSHKHFPVWLNYFASIQAFASHKFAGTRFLLSHFPYAGDHPGREDRCSKYRLRDEGMPLVHGHLHAAEIYHRDRRRQVHVGLDAWMLAPVPQEAVVQLVREVSQ